MKRQNSDGISKTDELVSLKYTNVTSINLNTNKILNRSLITKDNKIIPQVSQNYTLLSSINFFKQEILSQILKKDIINNNFFIFKNTLHVKDIKNRNSLKEVA